MSNIYLEVAIEKTDVLKISIFQVYKIRLQVSFWGVASQVDIIEF